MGVTLSDTARRRLAALETVTGASGVDCLVYDDRVVFVVPPAEMATAVGPDGDHVRRLEAELDTEVRLVEAAEDPGRFVANALAPAAVYDVTVTETEAGTVATAEVAEADRGVAIGADGRTIETARRLAARHFDLDDVQLA